LAGRLQRGLGSGYLEAVDRPRSEIEPILLACIEMDPRINAQDEARDLYYARLMLDLGIDEAPIGAVLAHKPDIDGTTTRDWLPVGVLGLLARSGRTGAARILREYVGRGAWWSEAIRQLGASGAWSLLDGLDDVLARRFAADPTEITSEAHPLDEEPWRSWRERGPLAVVLQPELDGSDHPIEDLEVLDAPALLRRVTAVGRRPDAATDLLVARIRLGSTADRHVVEAALGAADQELVARAIRVLGALGDPSIVPVGKRILVEIGTGLGVPGGRLRPMILQGFEGLDASTALPLAREWRDTDDDRRVIATRLLERHATADDLDWTVDAIRRAAAHGDDLYAYARILRRFPGTGPFEGFEAIYRTYVPTCCRAHLVDALSIVDPTYGSTLACECLYDCEPLAREAAARTVRVDERAMSRLRDLAADPLEADEVRAAAATRTS
jgi:hypothetical protein